MYFMQDHENGVYLYIALHSREKVNLLRKGKNEVKNATETHKKTAIFRENRKRKEG